MTTNILLIFALYIPRPRSSRVLWRMRQPKRSSGYGFLPAIWSHSIAGWQLWGASPRSVASSFFLRLAGIQSNTWWARLCEGGGRSAWPNHWRRRLQMVSDTGGMPDFSLTSWFFMKSFHLITRVLLKHLASKTSKFFSWEVFNFNSYSIIALYKYRYNSPRATGKIHPKKITLRPST